MNIETSIRRSDFLALQLYLVPRLRFTWISIGSLWFLISLTSVRRGNIDASTPALIASGLLTAVIFFLVFFLLYLAFALLTARRNGITGLYTYRIDDTGFTVIRNENEAETTTPWDQVSRIAQTDKALYIGCSWYQHYIIPRRAFTDTEQFTACGQLLRQYRADNI